MKVRCNKRDKKRCSRDCFHAKYHKEIVECVDKIYCTSMGVNCKCIPKRRGAMKKSRGKLIGYGATTKQLSEAGITRIVMPATTKRDISEGYKLLLRECEQDRDHWKARALKAEQELETYKSWALRIDKWHTELCEILGIKPIHPASLDMIKKLDSPIKLPKHFGEMRFKAACRKTNKGAK